MRNFEVRKGENGPGKEGGSHTETLRSYYEKDWSKLRAAGPKVWRGEGSSEKERERPGEIKIINSSDGRKKPHERRQKGSGADSQGRNKEGQKNDTGRKKRKSG